MDLRETWIESIDRSIGPAFFNENLDDAASARTDYFFKDPRRSRRKFSSGAQILRSSW
ncbi:hypothetical protein AXF42_Ash016938 [Apostasia shenzhenica]|uniref:Uncharacterized protein n=1 Tax=Apostasia shenzhenica TaxID=1088818 RepID=A0A2H9ZRI9_9ASPA|nr:hypothetical protein AXF42_Ash016938 [Apostasia shenzhenica]